MCPLFNKNSKNLINDQDKSQNACDPITWRQVYAAESALRAGLQAFAATADRVGSNGWGDGCRSTPPTPYTHQQFGEGEGRVTPPTPRCLFLHSCPASLPWDVWVGGPRGDSCCPPGAALYRQVAWPLSLCFCHSEP